MSSDIGQELNTNTTDDFGFKSLGSSIQLVSDFNEKLPYKKVNNFAYAPHKGLFAAAGANDLAYGSIESLRDHVKRGESFTQRLAISGINNVMFTKHEKYLLISTGSELKYLSIEGDKFEVTITESDFKTVKIPSSIEKVSSSFKHAELIAITDSDLNFYLFNITTEAVNKICSEVIDFDWSPTGEQLVLAKGDGTIRKINTDGAETATIEQPEDLETDSVLPMAITWLLDDQLLVTFAENTELNEEEEPFYDSKLFLVEFKAGVYLFKESYDAVVASGSVWRKYALYSASLKNLSNSLTELTIVTSSVSPEVSAITPMELLSPGNDAERASLPMNEVTSNDINPIGMAIDPRSDNGPIYDVCVSIPEAQWLPIVWVLGHDGRLHGWYIFHIHDVKNGSFKKDGVVAYEDYLYNLSLTSSPSTNEPPNVSEPPKSAEFSQPEKKLDNLFAKPAAFGSSNLDLADNKSPFGSKESKSTLVGSGFGQSSFGSSTENKSSLFGSSTENKPSPFGASGFGQSILGSSSDIKPSLFESPSSENKPSPLGSSGFGQSTFGSTENKSGFGSSGFGQSTLGSTENKSGFGSSGFGQSTLGSTENKSGFGSSGFGQSTFGSSENKSGFGSSGFGSSGFGQSTFGSSENKSGFGSSGFGQSTFAPPSSGSLFENSQAKKSPFASLNENDSIFGGDDKKHASSPFASLNKNDSIFGGDDKKHASSPFASLNKNDSIFGGDDKKHASSPFASLNKNDSIFGGDDKKHASSPFASLNQNDSIFGGNDKKDTSSPFAAFDKTGAGEESPFASFSKSASPLKTEHSKSLVDSEKKKDPFTFGSKESFLSGIKNVIPEDTTASSDSDVSDDQDELDSSDEEVREQQQVQPAATSSAGSAQSQGPTSFGNVSFGAPSGIGGFGQSMFGQSSFGQANSGGFGQAAFGSAAPESTVNGKSDAFLNTGSSGFGLFASQKTDFGGKNIFEQKQNKDEPEGCVDSVSLVGEEEKETVEIEGEGNDTEENKQHEDEETAGNDQKNREKEVEESKGNDEEEGFGPANAPLGSDDDLDELNEDIEENLNVRELHSDAKVDNDLAEDVSRDLRITTEAPQAVDDKEEDGEVDDDNISLPSSEEDLYKQAKSLNPDGEDKETYSNPDNDRSQETQVVYETADISINTAPKFAEIEIQTEPIKYETVGVQSFENDALYQGEFALPASVKPYVSLKDIQYPALHKDPVLNAIEKLIYDTEAELSTIEENSDNIRDFINDHLKVEVEHGLESTRNAYQWRLGEAKALVDIVKSEAPKIKDRTSQIGEQLELLHGIEDQLKSCLQQSQFVREQFYSLLSKENKKIHELRELPIDTKVLQERVRKQNLQNNSNLRIAEEKVLVLKTALETLKNINEAGPAYPNVLQGIVNHLSLISENYSNDTREISARIAKLNKNHVQILEKLKSSSTLVADNKHKKAFRQLKLDSASERIAKVKFLSTSFRLKRLEEVTSTF